MSNNDRTRIRIGLVCLSIFLLILTSALDQHHTYNKRIDACYIRREIEKPLPSTFRIPLGDGVLHNYSVYIMWIAMFLLVLLPNKQLQAAFSLTYGSLWFHNTYILLAAMKAVLQDVRCAGRHTMYPNGISGHYCYFIFVSLTAYQFSQSRLKSNRNASPAILSVVTILMTLFGIGAFATLYRTFFHGYHSARQIFLGSALGIISHVFLDLVLFPNDEQFYNILFQGEFNADLAKTAFMAANSFLSFALYFKFWPHIIAGPAITTGNFIFHIGLWGILITILLFRMQFQQKIATA